MLLLSSQTEKKLNQFCPDSMMNKLELVTKNQSDRTQQHLSVPLQLSACKDSSLK